MNLCFICTFCNSMTNSTERLDKHATTMHHGMPPKFIISESDYTSMKQVNSLSVLTSVDGTARVKCPTKERYDILLQSDLTFSSEYISEGTEVDSNDLKPNVKELNNKLLEIKDSFSSSSVKTEMKYDDSTFNDFNQSSIKQETLLTSFSYCEVKDELMHCQSCSFSSVDFDKLKSHRFTQHPTEAAIITNYLLEADPDIHNIKFFCIKEMCSFSTTLCSVYEQHLLHCCSFHQTMSRIETDRLKSTITFVLDFHIKLGLSTFSGFLDFVSAFNKIYPINADQEKIRENLYSSSSSIPTVSSPALLSDIKSCLRCDSDNGKRKSEYSFSSDPDTVLLVNTQNTHFSCEVRQAETMCIANQAKHNEQLIKTDPFVKKFPSSKKGEIINIESGTNHLVSNNVELETDIAGKPLDDNNASFLEELRLDKIKDEVNFDAICSNCDKIFAQGSQFLMRTETCDGFICDECTASFGEDNILLKCMRKCEEEINFKCSESGESFRDKSELKVHTKIHIGEESSKANRCVKWYSDKNQSTSHLRLCAGEKPFMCNACGKGFCRKSSLTAHMRIHTGEKQFNGHGLDKGFCHEILLTTHPRVHKGEKPYRCNECGKGFSLKCNLKVHMKIHTGEKPYRCNECGKDFREKRNLTVHMRLHTGEKPFKCIDCGKGFRHKTSLTLHMKQHSGERSFSCNECGKDFGLKRSLTNHIRLHTREKPFICSECGKGFGVKSKFTRHMRVHTGEKPFECIECCKGFAEKSKLTTHMRVHTGEKPFICHDCGRGFAEKSKLTTHMRVHTGEKPFTCNECGKGFGVKSNLTKHMKFHTRAKPFKYI